MGVASSSDEDETLKRSKNKKLKKARLETEPLPPLDSELEDEKEGDGEEENLEWGKKRSAYYNADYVDEEWDGNVHIKNYIFCWLQYNKSNNEMKLCRCK